MGAVLTPTMELATSGGRSVRFARRVLAVVRRIPPGRVATYGDVAALAGRATACRAVGNILGRCRHPGVPCHRVVTAGGRLGGYGDPLVKQRLLEAEGVHVAGRRLRHFAGIRWRGARERAIMTVMDASEDRR